MRQLNKGFILFALIIIPISSHGQETSNFSHECSVIYGIYGFRDLNDAYLYKTEQTTGVFGARYMIQLDQKFSVGIEGAYENIDLGLKTNLLSENYYVKTFFITGKLNYSLINRKKYKLYVSGAFGTKRVNEYLEDDKILKTELVKEITLIGLQFLIFQKTLIHFELTNGDIALLKFGLTYRFCKNGITF